MFHNVRDILERTWVRWLLVVFAICLVPISLLIFEAPIGRVMGYCLLSEDPIPVRSSVAVAYILPGGVVARSSKAAELYSRQIVSKIVVPHTEIGTLEKEGLIPSEADLYSIRLKRLGVPLDKVEMLPGENSSTIDDAYSLKDWLSKAPAPVPDVYVVTSWFHTARAKWVLRRVLGVAFERVRMVAAPEEDAPYDGWWTTEGGKIGITVEYLKWGHYFLHHTFGRMTRSSKK